MKYIFSGPRAKPAPVRKLLLFAHTPPPYHGQSYMVEQVLHGLGGDARLAKSSSARNSEFVCYHINCRFSDALEDIGRIRWKKILLLLNYCLQAIWCRYKYGVTDFLYVPASPFRTAIYRDWLVMLTCRPFFRRTIYYWQAAGLAD